MTTRTKKPRGAFNPHAAAGRSDDGNAFIPDPGEGPARTNDVLAERMGEEFLEAATTAQDPDEERLDSAYPEEMGGPFIETSAEEEMADDIDGNNPPGAMREPLPRAVAGMVVAPYVEDPNAPDASDADEDQENSGTRDPADPGMLTREIDPTGNLDLLNEEPNHRN